MVLSQDLANLYKDSPIVRIADSDGKPLGSYNGSIDNAGQMAEIGRMHVPGAQPFSSFGQLIAGAGVTDHLLWPSAGGVNLTVPPSPGIQVTLVSTDAQDDKDGGTGIRSVHMHYLDGNLNSQSEEIELEGLTPVTSIAEDVRFVQCLHVETYGSQKKAAGNITVKNGAGSETYSIIAAGRRRCESSARRVPANKLLVITGLYGGIGSGTAATKGTISLSMTYIEGHDYTEQSILIPQAAITLQDSSVTMSMPMPFPVPAGVVVGMEATTDKGATINGGFFGWIEDVS